MLESLKELVHDPYFSTYTKNVKYEDISREMEDSGKEIEQFFASWPSDRWNHRYADGKWSVKEVLFHIVQTELIFNFRALTIASEEGRADLPGFDENQYVAGTNLEDRVPQWLMAFFKATRQQSILLSQMLSEEQLGKVGVASGKEVQVKALFYMSSGHTRHHLAVLKERYSK